MAVQPSGASQRGASTEDRRELRCSRPWTRRCGQELMSGPSLCIPARRYPAPPEVNSARGLKTLVCGQRFSDLGGSLEVQPRHHPITPGMCRGNCLGPRAPAPFQDFVPSLAHEQTFAKARGCSNPGRGPGGSSPPGRAARCIRCPTEGMGGEQLVAPKAPGSDVAAARGGKGGTGGLARLTRLGCRGERLGLVFTSGAALRG